MGAARLPAIAVVGPTATGKTDLALGLADRLGGPPNLEVVNADAMQLYRGMDIGTAKLPERDRRGYAHHLMDILGVDEDASVAAYQRDGRRVLAKIVGRSKTPLVVGGSGLYLRALLDQMEFPPTDSKTRARLEEELDRLGPTVLHAQLGSVDPPAAERIGPTNGRRLVRALEVIELTGRPYSASLPRYEYLIPSVQIGLRLPSDQLDQRIAARARFMFESGLVDEVESLVRAGIREGKTARRATGYAQALAVLDGELTLEEAWEQTAVATRQLARRQIKWFRRDPRIHWVDAADADRALESALEVVTASATANLENPVPFA